MDTKAKVSELLRTLPVEKRIEGFASQLAGSIRAAATTATDKWASLLVCATGLFDGEVFKGFEAGVHPAPPQKVGELVRVDFNLVIGMAEAKEVRRLIHMEIAPFIIGVGDVTVEDTPEGIVIARVNKREMVKGHRAIPKIEVTPAMVAAGIDEYALFEFADRGEWVVTAVYRAMHKAALIEGLV